MRNLSHDDLLKPFFLRPATLQFINSISDEQALLLHLGAGASADRTGLTWASLVEELLTDNGLSPDVAAIVVDRLNPMSAASALSESILNGGRTPQQIAQRIQSLLYTGGGRLKGQTMTAIADLAIEFMTANRSFEITTTNFDEFVAIDFKDQLAFWRSALATKPDQAEKLRRLKRIEKKGKNGLRVSFLHGRINESGHVADLPVLSERDYHNARTKTLRTLTRRLKKMSLLTVGASLSDPPLVASLLATRDEAEEKGLKRYAIIPRADVRAESATDTSVAILGMVQHRLTHLGVQGVFVDHHSQVGQFVREVNIATATSDYVNSKSVHGSRLEAWWHAWRDDMSHEVMQSRQSDDHRELVEALVDIESVLGSPGDRLKIEVWLRWMPPGKRELRLWASSFSRFSDHELSRASSIPLDESGPSGIAAKAFHAGRPIHEEASKADTRWKTYLAAPILISGLEESNLAVGTVIVASMRKRGESCLDPDNAGLHARALLVLQEPMLKLARARAKPEDLTESLADE